MADGKSLLSWWQTEGERPLAGCFLESRTSRANWPQSDGPHTKLSLRFDGKSGSSANCVCNQLLPANKRKTSWASKNNCFFHKSKRFAIAFGIRTAEKNGFNVNRFLSCSSAAAVNPSLATNRKQKFIRWSSWLSEAEGTLFILQSAEMHFSGTSETFPWQSPWQRLFFPPKQEDWVALHAEICHYNCFHIWRTEQGGQRSTYWTQLGL